MYGNNIPITLTLFRIPPADPESPRGVILPCNLGMADRSGDSDLNI